MNKAKLTIDIDLSTEAFGAELDTRNREIARLLQEYIGELIRGEHDQRWWNIKLIYDKNGTRVGKVQIKEG